MAKWILTLLLLLPGCAFAQTPSLQLFTDLDSQALSKVKANYAEALIKLNKENFAGTCQDRQRDLNGLKMADLERRNHQVDLWLAGSIYQDDAEQQTYNEIMLPSLDIQLAEFNLKICQIHQSPQKDDFSESGRRRNQLLYCYRDAQLQLNRTKIDWEVIDRNYPDSPALIYAEKMRAYNQNVPDQICE